MAMEKFHYTTESGAEIVLPRFGQIPAGMFRKHRKLAAADQMFTFLEEYLDEEMLEAYDNMLADEAGRFADAWQEDSGAPVGKSSGSSKK